MKKKMEAEAASRQADVDVHLDTRSLDSKGAYSTQHLKDKQLGKLSGENCTNCVRPDNKIMLSKWNAREFNSRYRLLFRATGEGLGWAILNFSVCQYY